MNIKKLYVSIILLIVFLSIVGCSKNNEEKKNVGYQLEYETLDTDGKNSRYKVDGNEYDYLLNLSGRSNNAKYDSYFVILSNDENLTFEDVDNRFWTNNYNSAEEFCIVEYGLIQ